MCHGVVLLAEDVDRNAFELVIVAILFASSSSRRTWIEMLPVFYGQDRVSVVLLAEDVDRNTLGAAGAERLRVVLLAEDVDRNTNSWSKALALVQVVLLAEDVDRNISVPVNRI